MINELEQVYIFSRKFTLLFLCDHTHPHNYSFLLYDPLKLINFFFSFEVTTKINQTIFFIILSKQLELLDILYQFIAIYEQLDVQYE